MRGLSEISDSARMLADKAVRPLIRQPSAATFSREGRRDELSASPRLVEYSPHPIAREGAWPATEAAVGCGRVGNRARSCGECGEGVTRRVRGLLSLEEPAHRRRGPVTGASRAGQLPLHCVEVRVSPKTAACRTLADNGCAERSCPAETNNYPHGNPGWPRRSAALPFTSTAKADGAPHCVVRHGADAPAHHDDLRAKSS